MDLVVDGLSPVRALARVMWEDSEALKKMNRDHDMGKSGMKVDVGRYEIPR
jgi:hypothetical protein